MGNDQQRHLYEFIINEDDDFSLKKTNLKVSFEFDEEYKISESDKRVVYKGTIDDKKYKKYYVVKVYKKKNKEMFYTISDLFDDLKNLYKAKSLVSNYTKKYQNNPEFIYMNFVNFYIGSEKEKDEAELKKILSNEESKNSEIGNGYNLIENYIDINDFPIFVNSFCEVKYKDVQSIYWFMHWNWVETKGNFLVCDLKGKRKNGKEFEFSSPSLQSKDKSYGNADNGVYSLISFLSDHKHNEHCNDLPWPSENNIERAKELKNNYTSDKCDGCKEIYDEIISSAFNPTNKPNLNYLWFLILVPIIVIIILIVKCKKKSNKETDLERNSNIEVIDQEQKIDKIEPTGNEWADI